MVGINVILTIVAFLGMYFLGIKPKDKNIPVSIGILGTFIGIFISLMFFKENNITSSIPELLGGLKFAFTSSILGLIVSLRIGYKERIDNNIEGKDELETLHLIFEELQKLNGSISGDKKKAISNQIAGMREENKEQQQEITKILKEFTENMAENNSQALIEALEGVMRDFNTKINEQFGDNFKQLNEGVGKMLQWQQNYKEQIEQHLDILKNSEESIKTSTETVKIIVEKSEQFKEVATSLQEQLKILGSNMQLLEQGVTKFDSVAENMEKLSVAMMNSIGELSNNFVASAEEITDTNKKQIEFMAKTIQNQYNELSKKTKEAIDTYEDIILEIKDSQKEILNNSMNQIEEFNNKTLEKVSDQVEQFDKELSEELTKTINKLGGGLTSISKTIAEDYQNLANALNRNKQN